jgi:beta-N-acetylhexosaminidase
LKEQKQNINKMFKSVKIILLVFILIFALVFGVYSFLIYQKDKGAQNEQIFNKACLEKEKFSNNLFFKKQIEEKLNCLSLEQKIGQLFIIGFNGKIISEETENLIKEIHPGGILLLDKNIEDEVQLKELINSLQEIALQDTGLPLFIAVDQEGGLISRINWINKTAQSEIKTVVQAREIGAKRGEELKQLGINLNFAPLVDKVFKNDFIFERSFQKDYLKTGELAEGLIYGQKQSGIFSALKHFPEYGEISFNPENELAYLDKIPDISQFQKAYQAFPEMIMVSNVVYRDIEEKIPFSFSQTGIKFLRETIDGNYLIVSDDLAQYSLLKNFSLEEIVILPIQAGMDLLIFSGWRTSVVNGIKVFRKAVENKEISEERINQSVLKIIDLKQKI